MYLLGRGISGSASPAMQNAAFRATGLAWRYELLDVEPDRVEAAVAKLRGPGVAGANVTMPYKLTVAALVDDLDETAGATQAVNTVVSRGARLLGLNTDVGALRQALTALRLPAGGTTAVILGAGGAARAAAAALQGERIEFVVVARRPEAVTWAPVLDWAGGSWRSRCRQADVVVNATPLGRQGPAPLQGQDLPRRAVIDLVHGEAETELCRLAREKSLGCVDGRQLLLWQGAAAFTAWTGQAAPLTAMREALAS